MLSAAQLAEIQRDYDESVGSKWLAGLLRQNCGDLLTHIRELQAQVDEYDHLFELQRQRERPWLEQWREETGKHDTLPDYGETLNWLMTKAEQARAECQQLQKELEWAKSSNQLFSKAVTEALRTTLALKAELDKSINQQHLTCIYEWRTQLLEKVKELRETDRPSDQIVGLAYAIDLIEHFPIVKGE